MSPRTLDFDVLVIGSGGAGLATALRIDPGRSIAVLSKGSLDAGSTTWAQGGVAAVMDERRDSVDSHIRDTLEAGAGLCHPGPVQHILSRARAAIDWLAAQGVRFDRWEADAERYHLTREGGHSHRRVIHAADETGRVISASLIERIADAGHVTPFEHHLAVDLITTDRLGLPGRRCVGAYVLDARTGRVNVIRARHVVLATGGASKVYLYSTNPDGATGDGIAMAWRAGCRVANLEFNQFHPTCLYHPHAKSFLISEAVRGEGGRLVLPDGQRFMDRFHPRGELAPRDVVARAIDHEMKRLGADCVYLDITHRPPDFVRQHFPTIYSRCLDLGIDITRQPIPVVPAAHYTCGGVVVDTSGHTDVPGLFAVGETSFTGLHGANRMASNSLLECVVSAEGCASAINADTGVPEPPTHVPLWDESRVTDSDEDVVIAHNWDELRRCMWDYVGIVRTTKRLLRAQHRVELLHQEIREFYANYRLTPDFVELRNLVVVAELIVRSALARKESRGLHYVLDYPESLPVARDTILVPERRTAPPAAAGSALLSS